MGSYATVSLYRAPGVDTFAEQSIEELLVHPDDGASFKTGVQIAKGTPLVRIGDVLGMIQTGANSGKFRRYTSGVVRNTQVTGDSSIVLKDSAGNVTAPPFVPGDVVTITGASGAKTITAVYPNTGMIQIAGTLGGSVAVGATVALTTPDGSETAACIAARPMYPSNFIPSTAGGTAQIPLDHDMLCDVYWQGIFRLSVVKGLDAAAMTALGARSLSPFMDAVLIR
jgi:hypothetical protein